jgi:hypothetical protein
MACNLACVGAAGFTEGHDSSCRADKEAEQEREMRKAERTPAGACLGRWVFHYGARNRERSDVEIQKHDDATGAGRTRAARWTAEVEP